jgi:hypothetical protein
MSISWEPASCSQLGQSAAVENPKLALPNKPTSGEDSQIVSIPPKTRRTQDNKVEQEKPHPVTLETSTIEERFPKIPTSGEDKHVVSAPPETLDPATLETPAVEEQEQSRPVSKTENDQPIEPFTPQPNLERQVTSDDDSTNVQQSSDNSDHVCQRNGTFFILPGPIEAAKAAGACESNGGQLASISGSEEYLEATQLASFCLPQLDAERLIKIESWNCDSYNRANSDRCLGFVASPTRDFVISYGSCTKPISVMCRRS